MVVVQYPNNEDQKDRYTGPYIAKYQIEIKEGKDKGYSQVEAYPGTAWRMITVCASHIRDVNQTQFFCMVT